jgi:DNA-binding transcriptional ArsR family regulator
MKKRAPQESNPLLWDKARLAIMAYLAASRKPISFSELLEKLDLTRGNLSSHLRRLEDSGLLEVEKSFEDRKPLTTYCCNARGRKQVRAHLQEIEILLKGALRG